MTRLKTFALCLVAALTLSAVAVASASAEAPEFGHCVKKAKAEGSGYSNAGCTSAVASGAKYEWTSGPGAKAHFTSATRFVQTPETRQCFKWEELVEQGRTAEAAAYLEQHHLTAERCEAVIKENEGKGEAQEAATLETVTGQVVECAGVSATGEYSGPKSISNLTSTFTGCETQGAPCQSAGAATGEVVNHTLDGVLGIIKKESLPTNNTVGIDLFPASGEVVSELECGPFFGIFFTKIVVTGSVIHQVNTNKMSLEENEKFTQHKGQQKPENFDGEPQDVLRSSIGGGSPVQSGEQLLTRLTNEEKIEINSVV